MEAGGGKGVMRRTLKKECHLNRHPAERHIQLKQQGARGDIRESASTEALGINR